MTRMLGTFDLPNLLRDPGPTNMDSMDSDLPPPENQRRQTGRWASHLRCDGRADGRGGNLEGFRRFFALRSLLWKYGIWGAK